MTGQVSGNLRAGNLNIDISDGRFVWPGLFRGPIEAEKLTGSVVWNTDDSGLTVRATDITLQTPYGNGAVELTLEQPSDGSGGLLMDLTATASAQDARGVIPNLPVKIPGVVLDWLETAVVQGQVEEADFRINGDLTRFPFTSPEQGLFKIIVPVRNGTLKFNPSWPAVEKLNGDLVFDGISMYSTVNDGEIAGTAFANIDARMTDMRNGELRIAADVGTDMPSVLRLLRESTIGPALGDTINDVTASGSVEGTLDLFLPVKTIAEYDLQAELNVIDATLALDGIEYPVSEVNGPVSIRRTRLTSDRITGRFLGEPVVLSLRNPLPEETGWGQIVEASGLTPTDKVAEALQLPFEDRYTGRVEWQSTVRFPQAETDVERRFEIVVGSDLQGTAIDLPVPLNKESDASIPVMASITFPERGQFAVAVEKGTGISARLLFAKPTQRWELQRGSIRVADGKASWPEKPGIEVGGNFEELVVFDWIELVDAYTSQPDAGTVAKVDFFREVDVRASALDILGYQFPDSEVLALQIEGVWYIDIDGPRAVGSVSVPSVFTEESVATVEMDRLYLLNSDAVESGDDETVDPRELPALSASVADFAIDAMRFGSVDADVIRNERGLKATGVVAGTEDFTITIDGDWYIIDPVNLTPRTRMRMQLESTDVAKTLSSLDYDPVVVAKQGTANADLTWQGMPGMGMIYDSKGSFGFRVEKGQVLNVDPGGGRLLGLLSLRSLPRRLSLDFRDVVSDGLGFDKLKGSFRLDEGVAYTCDLAMDGSVTDMAIIGSSSLRDQTYDQLAVIRPHMSNVVPLGTAVVAGPAVGAAVWLVAAIFKEPLSSIGEVYYQVQDEWGNPSIEKVDRKSIDTRRFKDCAANLPELSLEDVAALQELRSEGSVKQVP